MNCKRRPCNEAGGSGPHAASQPSLLQPSRPDSVLNSVRAASNSEDTSTDPGGEGVWVPVFATFRARRPRSHGLLAVVERPARKPCLLVDRSTAAVLAGQVRHR